MGCLLVTDRVILDKTDAQLIPDLQVTMQKIVYDTHSAFVSWELTCSLVNQYSQNEPFNPHPARNMSRMSTTSRSSRMSRLSTMSRHQQPASARESPSRLSRSSVTSRRKDITLIAREFPPVTKLGLKQYAAYYMPPNAFESLAPY